MHTSNTISSYANWPTDDFKIQNWSDLKPIYDELISEDIPDLESLENFIFKLNKLQAVEQEEEAWRFIQLNRNNTETRFKKSFEYFHAEIKPHIMTYSDKLNRKLVAHPAFDKLPDDLYFIFKRSLKREIDIFREESIPLIAKEQELQQSYGQIMSALKIEWEGKEITPPQTDPILEGGDREKREAVWRKLEARRAQDRTPLQELLDQLLEIRGEVAQNAGYESFTDFQFARLARFDYAPGDCLHFHELIEKQMQPVIEKMMAERREKLDLQHLRPWDMRIDIWGNKPLRPFESAQELIDKTAIVLNRLHPDLGEVINLMDKKGHFDLEARHGKSPGGFNYPLLRTGLPFVFMNTTGTQQGLTTMAHESGHALHSYLTRDLGLNSHKLPPPEISEVASMTMELFAMEHYDLFYPDVEQNRRARRAQLGRCLKLLSSVAIMDAFQHWLYASPGHSHQDRTDCWSSLSERFFGRVVDREGLEDSLNHNWLKILHIFQMPFYSIEYAFAQLGALAIWRNYKQNPEQAMEKFLSALKLGYTKSIPEFYAAAGIQFDYSEAYVSELMAFCMKVYEEI